MAKNLVSSKANDDYIKHKIQTQNMIIVALAIVIIVLIVVSSTAAWYIRTRTDSADLYLSNPVNIYITEFEDFTREGQVYHEHTVKQDILESYKNRIYPGDRIKLKLGVQIGSPEQESSVAYVRVKLSMSFSKISDDPDNPEITMEDMAEQNLIEYQNKPNENDWKLVDFNKFVSGDHEPDYWYVLKTTDASGREISRTAQNMEQIVFVDGFIKLSKINITNKYANCYFHVNYSVEAIQIPNVPDPLLYEGYGPWWDFVNGDIEDIG